MKVCVTGGAGYVGSALVPRLLQLGHEVTVLDRYFYGEQVFDGVRPQAGLCEVKGDIRDGEAVQRAMRGAEAVFHLACISNDPSYDLDPTLGKSINFDAFRPLVRAAREAGAGRFIYASSSSVYGIKDEPEVTEELALQPLTDYSKYKALCEDVLHEERASGFATVILRPSTVCGYARRLRLDLVVNILTNHAVHKGQITVFGGTQMRPNIHIADMVAAYVAMLEQPAEKIDGQVFNVGSTNFTVSELAALVRDAIVAARGPGVSPETLPILVTPTNDERSYKVSSERIRRVLGFQTRHTIEDAVRDLYQAFAAGQVSDPLSNPLYFNIKRMQELHVD